MILAFSRSFLAHFSRFALTFARFRLCFGQRDLLPIIEGSVVSTKHGNVSTNHMLFIASGAFHSVKPSDLMPELQGRLPVRVQLEGLSEKDLLKILTGPKCSLTKQYVELMATEGVKLVLEDEALAKIAKVAAEVNTTVENVSRPHAN